MYLAFRAGHGARVARPRMTGVCPEGVHRLTILASLRDHYPQIERQPWPDEVIELTRGEFGRILEDLEDGTRDDYGTESSGFVEDLAVSRLERIPLGVAYGQVSRISRSQVLKTGLGNALRVFRYLVMDAGGFGNFLEVQPSNDADVERDAIGWDEAYELAAYLVARSDDLRGVISRSWYNDPVVAEIAPDLGHLRERYVDNGGICFEVIGSVAERQEALSRIPGAREHYAERQYDPSVHICAWAKPQLMQWAEYLCYGSTPIPIARPERIPERRAA